MPADLDDVDLQILMLLSLGHSGRNIGEQLGLSDRTVQRRVQELRDVLHARTTIAAVVTAIRSGLID